MRRFPGKAFCIGLCLLASSAFADPATDAIMSLLQKQGYSEFRVSRTILGRVRIVAKSDSKEREIVVNPRTGEVLRDYWSDIDDDGERRSGLIALGSAHSDDASEDDDGNDDQGSDDHGGNSGRGSDNSGSGSDNSGSGSDNSGSGSDSSGSGSGDDGDSDGDGGSDDGGGDD